MYNNEIETKSLGKMRVLAHIKDIALIERLCDAPEKYVVGVGFNKKTDSWSFGIYHSDLAKALNSFNKTVALRINVATPEEIKTEQLNKALYILENAKDEYNISEGYDQFLEKMMQDLKEDFEMITENDSNLIEHFKDTSSKDTFSSIMVAGTILGGIELRNLQRENGKLDGEKEVFPYNKEQIKLIDRYNKLQETIDKMEQYAEQNLNCDEDMEI